MEGNGEKERDEQEKRENSDGKIIRIKKEDRERMEGQLNMNINNVALTSVLE